MESNWKREQKKKERDKKKMEGKITLFTWTYIKVHYHYTTHELLFSWSHTHITHQTHHKKTSNSLSDELTHLWNNGAEVSEGEESLVKDGEVGEAGFSEAGGTDKGWDGPGQSEEGGPLREDLGHHCRGHRWNKIGKVLGISYSWAWPRHSSPSQWPLSLCQKKKKTLTQDTQEGRLRWQSNMRWRKMMEG